MRIWVDADACPKVIKEILYRAATRKRLPLVLVANQWLQVPPSPFIKKIRVEAGFDVADNYIAQQVEAEDVVITADVPLAAEVIDKGAVALNPRGELYTENNIRQRLSVRNFNEVLRESGQLAGGPPAISLKDRHRFASKLEQLLRNAI